MMAIVYPILGVLIVGGVGLCFAVGLWGILEFVDAERSRREEGDGQGKGEGSRNG